MHLYLLVMVVRNKYAGAAAAKMVWGLWDVDYT